MISGFKLQKMKKKDFLKANAMVGIFGISALCILCIFSLQSIISWHEFLGSLQYESAVATGSLHVFYTRQFEDSIPIIFQLRHIFPYVLGWPLYILFIVGFFFLPYTKKYLLLRLAFLFCFIPNSFLYAKWTRFISPIFPLCSLFAVLFVYYLMEDVKIKKKIETFIKTGLLFIVGIGLLPGIAYMSIYLQPDIRFQASRWIYQNIPPTSPILSETANVIDIPIPSPISQPMGSYNPISFNFYDLDQDYLLVDSLNSFIKTADYIFVPSRRLFKNVNANYPRLENYYEKLFSGEYGFSQVKTFESYPKISVLGHTLFSTPDEDAEETWTVFDHPVIRIYKKN
jgi:hypothetical protein